MRGDKRGWIDDGKLMPPLPWLVGNEGTRMAHDPYLFDREQLHAIGQMIGESLTSRSPLRSSRCMSARGTFTWSWERRATTSPTWLAA